MNNDQKIIWIDALLARNDNQLTAPLNLPQGLLSQDGIEFKFNGGSFDIGEAKYYMEHGTLGTQIKHDSELLTKRQEVALRILCSLNNKMSDSQRDILYSLKLADAFLEESSK